MNTIRLMIFLIALSPAAAHAKSLEDANLWEDMHSILKEYHFQLPSDGRWCPDGSVRLAQEKVFTGSAVLVVDVPTPAPDSYAGLAIQICRGFRKIYGLGTQDSTGDRVIIMPPGTNVPQAGEAYLQWTSKDDPSKDDESITLRVQVVALQNAKIGIFLTLVHVTPRSAPSTY